MRNQFEPAKLPTFEPLKPLTLPNLNQTETQSVPAKQSFQEFAMAGGGVPAQYKGREHVWHAKVGKHETHMAGGGLLKGMIKGMQKVLPASEREANLAKMLEGSKVKERVYHGTGNLESLQSFDPAMTGKGTDQLGSGFYFTTNPEEASGYATTFNPPHRSGASGKIGGSSSPGVIPARLSLKKPINVKGSNLSDSDASLSQKQALEMLKRAPNIRHAEDTPLHDWFDLSRTGGVTESMLRDVAKNYQGASLNSLSNDFYRDNPTEFRNALRDVTGYDGVMQDFGDGRKHYVAWFPEQIKSEIGNRGTYDISDPDLNKAEGGAIYMKKGGDPLDEFVPPRFRSAGRRPAGQDDRKASASMPVDFARGAVAGALGAPGDIESLIRMLPGLDEKTFLPTSEDIEKRLPFRSDTPQGRMASGLGTLAGGFYTGPGSPFNVAAKGAKLAGEGLGTLKGSGAGTRGLAGQRGAVKLGGGNWVETETKRGLKRFKPDESYSQSTINAAKEDLEQAKRDFAASGKQRYADHADQIQRDLSHMEQTNAFNKWVDTKVEGYVKKQMSTPDDPVVKMLDARVEKINADYDAGRKRLNKLQERIDSAVVNTPEDQNNLNNMKRTYAQREAELESDHQLALESILPGGKEYSGYDYLKNPDDRGMLEQIRKEAGFPAEGYGKSRAGKAWEAAADLGVIVRPAEVFQNQAEKIAASKAAAMEFGQYANIELPDKFKKYLDSMNLSDVEKQAMLQLTSKNEMVKMLGDSKRFDELSNARYQASEKARIPESSMAEDNPFLANLPPETPVYNSPYQPDLGVDHVLDILKQDVANGSLKLEDLSKITMDQAIKRAGEYDFEMAKRARDAKIKQQEGFPVHKDYPEGYKWIELAPTKMPENWAAPEKFSIVSPSPGAETLAIRNNETGKYITTGLKSEEEALKHLHTTINKDAVEAALKYEGDTMGHCVGGYCPEVMEGRSRIYSLRDLKGKPHVTVETKPGRQWSERSGIFYDNPELEPSWAQYSKQVAEDSRAKGVDRPRDYILGYPEWLMKNDPETFAKHKDIFKPAAENVTQIFGKSNSAPKEDYLPYIQDFVKSGKWSGLDTRELKNAGLYSAKNVIDFAPENFSMSRNARTLALGRARAAGELPDYMTRAEYEEILKKHVPEDMWSAEKAKRAAEDDDLLQQLRPPEEGMAHGGEPHMAGGGLLSKLGKAAKSAFAAEDLVPAAGRMKFADQPKGGLSIMKETGGNWVGGNVEKGLKPLKPYASPTAEDKAWISSHRAEWEARPDAENKTRALRAIDNDMAVNARNEALNNWVDRNLGNYVKKQMATKDDPVRGLFEQGITHIDPANFNIERERAFRKRLEADQPQLGQTQAGKSWENAADSALSVFDIEKLNPALREPWMEKAPKGTKVVNADDLSGLGFDHIMDVLREDLTAGRIRPEQMSKISITDAVRRTYQYDQDMAKKMAEAQIKATEGMPVHKDYGDKGYKWIELQKPKDLTELPAGYKAEPYKGKYSEGVKILNPAGEQVSVGESLDDALKNMSEVRLEEALKYEGETMGHCVGGYCPDVLEGRSRIYSLRDAKGEPHVTIEVQPKGATFSDVAKYIGKEEAERLLDQGVTLTEMIKGIPDFQYPQKIQQIKGKQNRAPKEEYLPYVQDFVKGGQWSDIGDLQNTGLKRYKGNDGMKYVTPEEYEIELKKELGLLPPEEGMAHGGEVHMQAGGLAKMLGKGLKAAKQAAPLVEAPSIIVPKGVSSLKEAARQSKGEYGARRVERAADEIPNLEKMYNEKALRESFLGDNAKAVVTMNPADFERYAQILKGRTKDDIGPKMAELARQGEIDKYTVPIDEYIQHLMRVEGGFEDVPYLNLFKDEVGLPSKPEVRGHEGRHRSRALSKAGETKSLVQINPRGDLREGLPRRSQEEYINALREELERSGRLVLPEVDGSYSRPAVEFPEPYAKGGEVRMAGGGAIKAALAKLGKFATESDLKAIKEAGRTAHEQDAFIRAAKNAEIEEKLKSMPARSKAANIEMGMYHPVGGGAKLSKPFEAMHSTRVKNPKVDMPEVRIMTPEDLYREEAGLFPLVGDKADTGTFLTHIGEKEFEVPVGLGGGPRYMDANLNPANRSRSAAWESGTGRVTSLGNQARRIGESGRPAYGIYTAGSGTNTDFNIMGANAILQQLGQSKLTKKAEKAFDQAMREGTKAFPPIPDWPGIRSPKAEDLLLDKSQGILRTKLFDTMGKEDFQSMGFPDVPATRKAIMDPQLLDVPTHEAGFRIARMDPTGRVVEDPLHPSDYPTAMAGELEGQLNMGVDYKDMFSTHFANRRLLSQPESGDYYSFSRAFPIQYADQEWLDKIKKAQEAKEKLIKTGSYAKGGDVKPKGGLAAATKSCSCHD